MFHFRQNKSYLIFQVKSSTVMVKLTVTTIDCGQAQAGQVQHGYRLNGKKKTFHYTPYVINQQLTKSNAVESLVYDCEKRLSAASALRCVIV